MVDRRRTWIDFFCYLAVILCLTLAPMRINRPGEPAVVRKVPFDSVRHFFKEGWTLDMLINLPGNIGAFVPMGIFVGALAGPRGRAWHAALAGAAFSLTVEGLQYATRSRVTDIDDVILNTLGSLLGYACFRAWVWASASARSMREKRRSSTLG